MVKKFFNILILLMVLIPITNCAILGFGSSSGNWKDVIYHGEEDIKKLEGTIWTFFNRSRTTEQPPFEVEFQSEGKLVSSNDWRNASWERIENYVKYVIDNGDSHFEGIYNSENNTISGTISRSNGNSSEIIMDFVRNAINSGTIYNIGDRGPAGGIIFYDKESFSFCWRYMEAAPVDLSNAQYGLMGIYARGVTYSRDSMGDGKANTEILVEALNSNNESRRAAQLCAQYSLNGYNDWFLPSYSELNYLYNNLGRRGLGGFKKVLYWSSSQTSIHLMRSERGTHNAFAKDFNPDTTGSYLGYYAKDNILAVRAVRLVMEQ